MEHPPTVEASIDYWEAIRVCALQPGDHGLEQTAAGLRLSYGSARRELIEANTPHRARR
jgi:hypothetical protein